MERNELKKRAEVAAQALTIHGPRAYNDELTDAQDEGAHLRTFVEAVREALRDYQHREVLVQGTYKMRSPNRLLNQMEERDVPVTVVRVRGWGVSGKGTPDYMDNLIIKQDGESAMEPFRENTVERFLRLVEKSPSLFAGK